MSRWGHIFKAC